MVTRPLNVLIIPCYNEAKRLDGALVHELVHDGLMHVLLVNDGSTDETGELLTSIVEAEGGRVRCLDMPRNSGKAEAVRRGLLAALEWGASSVGYADADFATPPVELRRLLACLDGQKLGAVLGCRVARLGTHIERHASRHIVSRVFASITSAALGVTVYDTQCGAKWFRDSLALRAALAQPFRSSWAFDVELLGRLLGRWGSGPKIHDDDILEIPIRAWRDVQGSKVSLSGMVKALADLSHMLATAMTNGRDFPSRLETVPPASPTKHPRSSWAATGLWSRAPSGQALNLPPLTTPKFSMIPELAAVAARRNATSAPPPPGQGPV